MAQLQRPHTEVVREESRRGERQVAPMLALKRPCSSLDNLTSVHVVYDPL